MASVLRRRVRRPLRVGEESGQILPIFALAILALFAMAALLFDAAQALVLRRQLQDATDAAALAAANVIQSGTPRGCSATAGPPAGAPRSNVDAAARASLNDNLADNSLSTAAVVTCPDGWSNAAVRVELTDQAESFFAAAVGRSPFSATARSTAINGYGRGAGYSVLTLNPYQPTWGVARRGCASMIFNGAPKVTFEGNVQINSACPRSDNGGALQMSGTASQISLSNGAKVTVVGEVNDTAKAWITPTPLEYQPVVADPLATLPRVDVNSLPVQSSTQVRYGNQTRTFNPGRYIGGIELRNSATALFRPGIYVFEPESNGANGGLNVDAGAQVFTVKAGATAASTTTWATVDCPPDACGALFYNKATSASAQILLNGAPVWMTRAYNPDLDTSVAKRVEYQGLAFWQDKDPVPTQATPQPKLKLIGGSTAYLNGTIYAPSALVELGGGAGGGGGYDLDYYLQFIAWDVAFSGTANWRMQYSSTSFVRAPDYGLVE